MGILQPLTYPTGSRILPGIHENVTLYASINSVVNIYWKDGIATSMNLGQGVSRAFKLKTIDDKLGIQVISGSLNVVFDYQDQGSLFDVVYALYGNESPPSSFPLLNDTPLRALEHMPNRYSATGANPAPAIEGSIAAGASGSVGPIGLSGSRGPYLYVVMGIDNIGNVSPTGSYIKLLDNYGNVMAGIHAAVNSPFSGMIVLPYAGADAKYKVTYLNADSVAHYFFCAVFPVNA